MTPRALVFDAYGTLFDVHSIVARSGDNVSGDLRALSTLWRQKQLEYTWLRSLMERYEDFPDARPALEALSGSPEGHSVERFTNDVGVSRPSQRHGILFCRSSFGR